MPTTQTHTLHSLTSIKPKHYWQLFVREDGKWSPQFGDFERAVVADEANDYHDHGVRRKDMRIVRTTSLLSYDAVMQLAARLDAGEKL